MKNPLEYDETGGRSKSCYHADADGILRLREKTAAKKKTKADENTKSDHEGSSSRRAPYSEDEAQMLKAYDVYQKYVEDPKDARAAQDPGYHRAKLMGDGAQQVPGGCASSVEIDLIDKFDGSALAPRCSARCCIDLLTITLVRHARSRPIRSIKTIEEPREVGAR